jgi:hypothetical protein
MILLAPVLRLSSATSPNWRHSCSPTPAEHGSMASTVSRVNRGGQSSAEPIAPRGYAGGRQGVDASPSSPAIARSAGMMSP